MGTVIRDAAISLLVGYIVGMINPSYIIGKFKGFDIRKRGSGNAGGSNALITMGKPVGALCMVFDVAKAYGIIKLVTLVIFPNSDVAFACTAVGTVLGHVFPVIMKFKGGKGLACLGGSILAAHPLIFLGMLAAELVVVLATDYICFVPITASVIFPVVYGLVFKNLAGALILLAIIPVIFYRHAENIRRIRYGVEARFSLLWNKEKERERLEKNIEELKRKGIKINRNGTL